jgi:hypothetical protein
MVAKASVSPREYRLEIAPRGLRVRLAWYPFEVCTVAPWDVLRDAGAAFAVKLAMDRATEQIRAMQFARTVLVGGHDGE